MIVVRNLFINYHFIVSTIIKPRPISTKPSSLSLIAKKLSISEQLLKKQMYDPNSKQISPQQLKVLGIINEVSINTEQKFELKKKSAVVTIMGHVDHGKTTLIDYLRNSNITEGQAGGITQKIGAFHIKCHSQKITFIDTPGHEAFTNMRKRGAMVTDLIILIISAVQGIKRQTIQILSLIQTYKIPTIIAINKIDLLQGDPEAVEKNLNQIGVPIELFGGNIPVIHISAKKGTNIQLLSGLIVEETQHLKAIQEGLAEAVALQVYQNSEGLNCLIMIIKKGILKRGSILLIGDRFMKLKNMYDDCSNLLNIAYPGDAVVVIGIPNIPNAGDLLYEIENENKARFVIQKKQLTHRQQNNSLKTHGDNSDIKTKIKLNTRRKKKTFYRGLSSFMMEVYKQKQDIIVEIIENLKNKQQTEEVIIQLKVRDEQLRAHKQYIYEYLLNSKNKKDLMNIIFKFVDRGIQETILQQISTLKKKIKQKYDIQINMMSSDIGNIDKKDIYQARLFNAEIFGFGVQFHEDFQVDNQLTPIKPKLHQLIHEFLKDLQNTALEKKKKCLSGVEQGRCDIVEVYLLKMGKKKTNIYAAGVRVSTGKINIKNKIYIFKNNLPISQGFQVESINVFKKSVSEVIKGTECTIILRNKQESLFERGDQFVSYE